MALFYLLDTVNLKTSRIMLFRDIMAVYCAHHKKKLRAKKDEVQSRTNHEGPEGK
jgi:hypothetical protein